MSGELEVLGWALLHSVWQGGLVAAGLWLVLRLAPASAVRVRYAVTLLALGALLTLPALNYGRTMAVVTLIAHAMYGLVLGGLYEPVFAGG